MKESRIIVGPMETRLNREWEIPCKKQNKINKRLRRNYGIFAVVSLCMAIVVWMEADMPDAVQTVMSHVTADFEYDDTLGRLQFVSNILPESAMVFLESGKAETCVRVVDEEVAEKHSWSALEPWIEYACIGDVMACMDGEVAAIVENRAQEYTVRLLHDDGCESVYSGLKGVVIAENEYVSAGTQIGTSAGTAAFEWRKDGLSVQPVFGESF